MKNNNLIVSLDKLSSLNFNERLTLLESYLNGFDKNQKEFNPIEILNERRKEKSHLKARIDK